MDEVDRVASDLPYPGVGPAPDGAHQVRDVGEPAADVPVELLPGARVEPRGLEDVAIDVQLGLRNRGVTNANRSGSAVSVEAQSLLGSRGTATQPIEHLQSRVRELGGVHQPPEESL